MMDPQNNLQQDLVDQKIQYNSSGLANQFALSYTKENCKFINKKINHKCRILQFSTEWSLNEILENVCKLKSKYFPYLFIIKIEMENYGFSKPKSNPVHRKHRLLKQTVINFSKNRPILLYLTSLNEKITKHYFKNDDIEEITYINQDRVGENFIDFPTFFCCLMGGTIKAFDKINIHKILKIKNSHLALKLLKIWMQENNKNSEELTKNLIFESASKGSKTDFLAALDSPFVSQEIIHNVDAQKFMSELFDSDETSHKKLDHIESIPNHKNDSSYESVLQCAVQNSNTDVIDFLIENCTHLIQQLPFEHQVCISTNAFTTKQYKVLADLLEFSDFPFPSEFQNSLVDDERLLKIIKERTKFHDDIESDNFEQLKIFNDRNANLKIVRNTQNESALLKALTSKKYEIYFKLKSLGFQATEFSYYKDYLTDKQELQDANAVTLKMTKMNINKAKQSSNKSIMLLCTRSFIHNKRLSNDEEKKCRQKIKYWYECIYKTEFGCKLLDAVCQCDKLKIIYDFECKSVSDCLT